MPSAALGLRPTRTLMLSRSPTLTLSRTSARPFPSHPLSSAQAPHTAMYSSMGGQAQMRLRSPAALSTSPTAGQYLNWCVQGAG